MNLSETVRVDVECGGVGASGVGVSGDRLDEDVQAHAPKSTATNNRRFITRLHK